jgi:hypothetical protein
MRTNEEVLNGRLLTFYNELDYDPLRLSVETKLDDGNNLELWIGDYKILTITRKGSIIICCSDDKENGKEIGQLYLEHML